MMGQAKNRGTREQRVAQAIARWREGPNLRGTATGRISGREPQFKELPRVEVQPLSEFVEATGQKLEAWQRHALDDTGDLSNIEARVVGLGGLDLDRRYEVAYGNPQKLGDVVRPPIRLAHVGLQGRGRLALAALAAMAESQGHTVIIDEQSVLKGVHPPPLPKDIVLDDISDVDFTPEQLTNLERWYKKGLPNAD